MVVNEIKEVYEKFKEVKFKLYSLEYVIKEIDTKIAIYPILYEIRKKYYNSIEEALNNFTIFNESIIENIDRLILIK